MKVKNIRRGLVALLLLIAIAISCVAVSGTVKTSAQAVGEQNIAYLSGEKWGFTDTKEPNGIDVREYESQHYGKTVTLGTIYEDDVRISGNDDIIKIIPSELFKKVGKTLHIGKGYGFFVDCQKKYDNSDILLSTVIIIDIGYTNNMFDEEVMSHLKIKLTPIFQGDFAYIKRGEAKTFSIDKQDLNFFKDRYAMT